MKIINKTKIASVDIAEVRVSDKDELEGIRDDVREVLLACGKSEKIMALT